MSLRSIVIRMMFGHSDRKRDKNLKVPENISVQRDIPYGEGGMYQLLDVVKPRNATGKLPVIVSVHGGGFVYGTKEVYQYYAANLAENGFAVVNFNYRLAPEHRFPAQLEDINAVLRWMTLYGEEYGFDLNNVFMVGDSAGAHLASHYLAIWSNPEFAKLFDFLIPKGVCVRAAALNCGLYTAKASDKLFDDYLTRNITRNDRRLDILTHLTNAFPPAFVMTARYDFLREEAQPMYEALVAAGVPAVFRMYGQEGQKHMGHVFHVNQNLPEAKLCNKDQCDFFMGNRYPISVVNDSR